MDCNPDAIAELRTMVTSFLTLCVVVCVLCVMITLFGEYRRTNELHEHLAMLNEKMPHQ